MDAYKPLSSILSDWSIVSGRGIWEEYRDHYITNGGRAWDEIIENI
jgi:hypothetical protein